MSLWQRSSTPVLAAAVLICHFVLSFALIPPWQQPDEPTFVAWAEWQRNGRLDPDAAPDSGREGEIIQSMARHDWWAHRRVNGQPPDPLPEDFTVTGSGTPAATPGRPPGYPWTAARFLAVFRPLSIEGDLYLLRTMSALLGLLTLWVAWLAARESLGALGGATVAMLLALHPQFTIVSTSAASDALANLLAALAWWQVARIVRGRTVGVSVAVMWCVILAAAIVDRMAVPIIFTAGLASIVALWTRLGPIRAPLAMVTLGCLLTIAAWNAPWAPAILQESLRSYHWGQLFSVSIDPAALTWDLFSKFTAFLHQSWWFSLGWGRYAPPSGWMGLLTMLTLVAACGIVRRLFARTVVDGSTRGIIVLALATLAAQAGAVYWMYYRFANGSQGKSLFPALVPTLLLLWVGVAAWVPERYRSTAAAALVAVLALFDLSVWTLVAIPAYYASF